MSHLLTLTETALNDPELSDILPQWGEAFTFDAENGPATAADVFGAVEVETWDEPMVAVADQAACRPKGPSRPADLSTRGEALY
jgi:hypothetical protein